MLTFFVAKPSILCFRAPKSGRSARNSELSPRPRCIEGLVRSVLRHLLDIVKLTKNCLNGSAPHCKLTHSEDSMKILDPFTATPTAWMAGVGIAMERNALEDLLVLLARAQGKAEEDHRR